MLGCETQGRLPIGHRGLKVAGLNQGYEIYYDPQGQRIGTAATYYEVSLGWQHWLSLQVELRPEIGYYQSNGAKTFDLGIKNYTVIAASDVILHF